MPHQEIPWKQIYDLSLQCCKYRSTKSFSVSLLREMNRLVPFDEAVVFYLNGNLKITDWQWPPDRHLESPPCVYRKSCKG